MQAALPPAPCTRSQLVDAFDELLQPALFRDYGPNGLQVEGRGEVRHLVSGVTASLALIDAAIAAGADAILVHHGLFWRGHDGRLTGWMKQRVARLLAHDISLIAYHLPLDAHAVWGNNAQLGATLGWVADEAPQGRFGEQSLGWLGHSAEAHATAPDLARHIERRLGRTVTCIDAPGRRPQRIAWCTGGAQSYFEAAIAAGADAFLTGEISEPQAHYARECGVAYIACGHHASERYGAPAVAAHVARRFGLVHTFIDIPNPA